MLNSVSWPSDQWAELALQQTDNDASGHDRDLRERARLKRPVVTGTPTATIPAGGTAPGTAIPNLSASVRASLVLIDGTDQSALMTRAVAAYAWAQADQDRRRAAVPGQAGDTF